MSSMDLLRRAVEKHSQAEVAAALDVSRQLVNRWLSGDRPFPPEHALYLAEWMGEPEPNHYELLAAATRHESRRRWLQKKARAVAGCSVLMLALGIVSPTLEARGYQEVNTTSTVYIMRISTAPYCN
ncbi:MAG: helix-turn-helix domain-containing protein [Algiphilus sp.]|uniref:helix-turn-helix domain-containing protein n=1 Tax=Algiphilus sp. TaxID=1872431 RepID=UPI0032EAFC4F